MDKYSSIIRPMSPFERRMSDLCRLFPPPPDHPSHKIETDRIDKLMETDLSFRLWLGKLQVKMPAFFLERIEGGSKLPIANILRSFFNEYASRLAQHGPQALPTSFNVAESFLKFSHEFYTFDLREEREYLLRLSDYIDWYTADKFPDDKKVLIEIMDEGITYSYNFARPEVDFRIETSDSELIIMGLAMIRHDTEISIIALCGEAPPDPPDSDIPDLSSFKPVKGKEGIKQEPSYSTDDRYLDEASDYARVIGLVRVDLLSGEFVVRYANQDIGPSYLISTDDPSIFDSAMSKDDVEKMLENSSEILLKYKSLFAFITSSMFLPVFFISEMSRVNETIFSTDIHATRNSTNVRKAIKTLGQSSVHLTRKVFCLQSNTDDSSEDERIITPPDLEFAQKGFWKTLMPGDIGEDENGQPIVGKTWVERTDTWSNNTVDKFILRKAERKITGPNVGFVYVMRSDSHGPDIYKIGLTTRDPDIRARDLTSSTGVPTGFGVLAHWHVGDVNFVEREAHRRLKKYRINSRREFFRAPLPLIIETLNNISKEDNEQN